MEKQKKKPIRVFEAFAGIGAQARALERAKIPHKLVGISEWFIDAIIAYDALNTSNRKVTIPSYDEQLKYLEKFSFSRDSQTKIKKLESLGKEKIQKLYIANKRSHNLGSITEIKGSQMPDCDLLTYSFPCQDLSTGGKTLGMKKGSGTRSGLLWEIERILYELRDENRLPERLLLENVSTILAESNINDLNDWLKSLANLGYHNSIPVVLDASEFGVPQDRKRCIIVSSLLQNFELDGNLTRTKDYNTFDFLFTDYSNPIFKQEADAASLNPTPSREIMWKINKRVNISSKTIFHTITCNMDRNNNAGMIAYEEYPGRHYRLLTIREAFLMMGYTESEYQIVKLLGFSYRKMNKLIGNSIVVSMLQSVFEMMYAEPKK
jgi:DNA (cytosine-5)-methyltransferase 1